MLVIMTLAGIALVWMIVAGSVAFVQSRPGSGSGSDTVPFIDGRFVALSSGVWVGTTLLWYGVWSFVVG